MYGSKYQPGRTLKEIAELVRQDIKKAYGKGYKFSVRKDSGFSYNALWIEIKEVPFELWATTVKELRDSKRNWGQYVDKVNRNFEETGKEYTYEEFDKELDKVISNSKVKSNNLVELYKNIEEIANAYNYDRSDVYIDYFDYGFTTHIRLAYELEYPEV